MKSILPSSRRHDISFHPSGKIEISARVARKLSLVSGDVVGIAEERGELFLYVRLRAGTYTGRHKGCVSTANHGRGTFRTYSKAISRSVLSIAGTPGPLRCPCGAEIIRDNKTYITIIYRCAL